jgi:hypothetical protein
MINLLTKLFRSVFPLPSESYLGKVIKVAGTRVGRQSCGSITQQYVFYFLVLEDDGKGRIGGPVVSRENRRSVYFVATEFDPGTISKGTGRKNFYRRNKRRASVWLNAVENGFPQGTVCLNGEGVLGVVATYYCGTFYGTTVSGHRLWTSKTPTLVEEKI